MMMVDRNLIFPKPAAIHFPCLFSLIDKTLFIIFLTSFRYIFLRKLKPKIAGNNCHNFFSLFILSVLVEEVRMLPLTKRIFTDNIFS